MNDRAQLPLALRPPPRPSFDNFIAGPNASLLSILKQGLDAGSWTLLKGHEGHGRSHLLTAAFHHHQAKGRQCAYLPLTQPSALHLLPVTSAEFIVVDDIDAVAGKADAELALFNALNEWRAAQSTVLMSATGLDHIALPDLRSRLAQAGRLTLKPLSEADLLVLVQQWAAAHEAVLGQGAAAYLVRRAQRSPAALSQLVADLAGQALNQRRAVTIPLIRAHLDAGH